jgi:MinD superfamily P-loop ATPase
MDKILVAIIVIFAAAYLFRRFYVTFKGKETRCECGSCDSNCDQSAISCESCDAGSIERKKFE